MPASDATYELLDFGAGRKLERFGAFVLDRPCAAAERAAKAHRELWREVTARYDRTQSEEGVWAPVLALPEDWNVFFADVGLTFHLQPSPFGHVGVFPEQRENWKWIARQVARAQIALKRPVKV